jgi:hypothetical protein
VRSEENNGFTHLYKNPGCEHLAGEICAVNYLEAAVTKTNAFIVDNIAENLYKYLRINQLTY